MNKYSTYQKDQKDIETDSQNFKPNNQKFRE